MVKKLSKKQIFEAGLAIGKAKGFSLATKLAKEKRFKKHFSLRTDSSLSEINKVAKALGTKPFKSKKQLTTFLKKSRVKRVKAAKKASAKTRAKLKKIFKIRKKR